MAGGPVRPNCWPAPRPGGPGAPMPRCICGRPAPPYPTKRKPMPSKPPELRRDRLATPLGTALLVTDGDGCLRALDWHDYEDRILLLLRRHYGAPTVLRPGSAPAAIRSALAPYFPRVRFTLFFGQL